MERQTSQASCTVAAFSNAVADRVFILFGCLFAVAACGGEWRVAGACVCGDGGGDVREGGEKKRSEEER